MCISLLVVQTQISISISNKSHLTIFFESLSNENSTHELKVKHLQQNETDEELQL